MEKTRVTENPLGILPIPKLIVKFALPSTIALVVNAFYNIIDQIFIGRGVGYLGNGATNVVFPIMVFAMALAFWFGDGCTSYMSLELGRGHKENASRAVGNTVVILIAVSVLFSVLAIVFLDPICRMLGATDNILPLAKDYGLICLIGTPFLAMDCALSSIVRADGSPNFSMAGLLVGCAINLVLDPLFIFGLNMGVKGAALATILGQIVNAIMLLFYLRKLKTVDLKKEYFILRWKTMKRVLLQGISSFIMQLAIVFLIAVSNLLLVNYGAVSKYGADIPIATMGITMKVNTIVINIIQGIATGSLPIMGFNYGAGKHDRTKKTYFYVIAVATVTTVIAFLIFQLAPMSVVSIFGSETDLYNEFAVKCLKIFLLACPLFGFQICNGFFFQAVGRPGASAMNTLFKQVFTILPAMFIMSSIMGVEGVLWAGPIADVLSFFFSLFLLLFFWKKIFPKAR